MGAIVRADFALTKKVDGASYKDSHEDRGGYAKKIRRNSVNNA